MAGYGLHVVAPCTVVLVGTLKPKGGHADHDELGVDLGEAFPRHALLLHALGQVVLDKAVGLHDEALKDFLAFGFGEVNGHGELVTSVGVEDGTAVPRPIPGFVVGKSHTTRQCLGAHDGGRGTRHLASCGGGEIFRGLDANDLRAPISEVHGGIGAGPDDSVVQDAESCER